MYVVPGQSQSLLSGSACLKLGLVARLHTLSKVPDFKGEFPELFKGLAKLADPYTIRLRPDVEPKCIYTARRIAHPLLPKVKAEIDRMITEGVISPVEQPTDWCSGIVVVPKPNNTVRICVDLTVLNHAVLREVHPLRSVDENLAKLSGSKIFTKLDANSGFWQMPLDPESRLLTTFLTPFGRFCMNRLPFGISSAPEIFQCRMSKILHDMGGVICHMDDILIHATTQKIHDERVRAVLQHLRELGLTLNEKCEFSSSMTFLGHVIDEKGIRADPSKVEGNVNFSEPSNVTELQRFLGMIKQLSKSPLNWHHYQSPFANSSRKTQSGYGVIHNRSPSRQSSHVCAQLLHLRITTQRELRSLRQMHQMQVSELSSYKCSLMVARDPSVLSLDH